MNADGSAVSRLGAGTAGLRPAWSPDGSRIAFEIENIICDESVCSNYIYLINSDGSGQTFFDFGFNPSWGSTAGPFGRPIASFQYQCTDLTCTFQSNSWDPDGGIVTYAWDFGDGSSGAGGTLSHAFAVAGSYDVRLTVTDNNGLQSSQTRTVNVWIPPVASFVFTCSGLTCNLDGSGSSDSDGSIVSYMWWFGDQTTTSGPVVTHAFPRGGNYSIVLTVTDNDGATSQQSRNTMVKALLHVGDLDGSSTVSRGTRDAQVTITIHDEYHRPVSSTNVTGAWNTCLAVSCSTDGLGRCTVGAFSIPIRIRDVTFTVGDVAQFWGIYEAARNHDPDGDSNGTSITFKP